MKRRPNHARRRTDDFRCVQTAKAQPRAGFSLIEAVAVAAILILLFTLYWGPSTTRNRQRKAQRDCQNQLQRLFIALNIYATEHDSRFPAVAGARTSAEALEALVPRYTSDTAAFFCPGAKQPASLAGDSLRQQRISYAYYMGRSLREPRQPLMSDQQVNNLARNAGEHAFSSNGKPPGNNHGKRGGNFLYCDGSVAATPPCVPFSLLLTQGVVLLNPNPAP
ncbi:MAG TPA: type II secretion system protein [Candidatus Paceibacterota bacterium]|nr:type II secretion system protein [Verrucomicrobiota bacterium]HSA12482.1 type II secretion system protein [Candidatus Paceibacterota bacterium]